MTDELIEGIPDFSVEYVKAIRADERRKVLRAVVNYCDCQAVAAEDYHLRDAVQGKWLAGAAHAYREIAAHFRAQMENDDA